MEKSVSDITLDLQRNIIPREITVRRGDTHRTLRFFLADGGRPYDLTDVRAVLTAQKPDGSHLFNDCTLVEDKLCYDLTSQTTSCPGQTECQLRLYGTEDALLTTVAFTLNVEDTVYTEGDEAIESTDEATALTRLVKQTEQKLSQVDDALERVASLQKNYELIEEFTLTEDVSTITRTKDPNGVAYDFSAITIFVDSPANTNAGANDVLIFKPTDANDQLIYYHEHKGGIGTSKRTCVFKARNDHGLCEGYSFASYTSNANVYAENSMNGVLWRNVKKITIGTYPSTAKIIAGTQITIYGIRG